VIGAGYAIGCAGHGVAMMSLGAQPAGMVLHGEPGPGALTTRRRIPMPPEPIRWLVAKGIMRGLAALDRRPDSRAQPRAGKEPAALEEAEREPAETV
jgi:gamma-glutamylputrescine oxidase